MSANNLIHILLIINAMLISAYTITFHTVHFKEFLPSCQWNSSQSSFNLRIGKGCHTHTHKIFSTLNIMVCIWIWWRASNYHVFPSKKNPVWSSDQIVRCLVLYFIFDKLSVQSASVSLSLSLHYRINSECQEWEVKKQVEKHFWEEKW